jgi:DNA-binding NtrC family response regulator
VDEVIWRTAAYLGSNKSRTAKVLGVGRRTIYGRLEHYDGFETNGRSNDNPYRNVRNGLT